LLHPPCGRMRAPQRRPRRQRPLLPSDRAAPTGAAGGGWQFASQTGGGAGEGSTLCLPLPAQATWAGHYRGALQRAVDGAVAHGAQALVVSLGTDALRGDPVAVPGAGMALEVSDFGAVGAELRRAGVPTVFVQVGGYDLGRAGAAVAAALRGFCAPPRA
jgi:acetoin utilization deacetylase AcuC-like enzyme